MICGKFYRHRYLSINVKSSPNSSSNKFAKSENFIFNAWIIFKSVTNFISICPFSILYKLPSSKPYSSANSLRDLYPALSLNFSIIAPSLLAKCKVLSFFSCIC